MGGHAVAAIALLAGRFKFFFLLQKLAQGLLRSGRALCFQKPLEIALAAVVAYPMRAARRISAGRRRLLRRRVRDSVMVRLPFRP